MTGIAIKIIHEKETIIGILVTSLIILCCAGL